MNSKHSLFFNSRYIAHAPANGDHVRDDEIEDWPWPPVAAAVCRQCWATFEQQGQLESHISSTCVRDRAISAQFNPGHFTDIRQGADEKVLLRYGVLRFAFCDNFFPRQNKWALYQERATASHSSDQQEGEQEESESEEQLTEDAQKEINEAEEQPKLETEGDEDTTQRPTQQSQLLNNGPASTLAPSSLELMSDALSASRRRVMALEDENASLRAQLLEIGGQRTAERYNQLTPTQSFGNILSSPPQAFDPDYLFGIMSDMPNHALPDAMLRAIDATVDTPHALNAQGITYARQQEIRITDPNPISGVDDSGYGGSGEPETPAFNGEPATLLDSDAWNPEWDSLVSRPSW